MHHHAGVAVSEPIVQRFQFIVSSVNGARRWRLIRIRGVNTDQWRQATRFWQAVRLRRFSDAAKANIAVGQHALMLCVKENLKQAQFRLKQRWSLGCFDLEEFTLHVAKQDLRLLERRLTLSCLQAPFFG